MIRKAISWPRVSSPLSTIDAPTHNTISCEIFCRTWLVCERVVPVIVRSKLRVM